MTSLEQDFLRGLKEVLGDKRGFTPLHEPEFGGNEWKLVKDCLDSTFVSSVGKYVDHFEFLLAEYTGAKYAVAVVNGTAALQISLLLAGVRAGDEVLIPALSFVATANAVVHCGGIPHFVDSEWSTLGLDVTRLANYLEQCSQPKDGKLINRLTGRRIAAIVPMHTYGHPVDMSSLLDLANAYNLPLVEDAAESLGSTYKGEHTGTFGLLGTLSFNGNKVITTGGGGAILTNNEKLARQAKHLTTTAKKPHRWEFFHDEVAWNYRLPNLNASLGCAQMECLPEFLRLKRCLAHRYQEVFEEISGVEFVAEPANSQSNYWLNTLRLKEPSSQLRDLVLAVANNAGYQCRPTWTLLNKLPMYTDCPRSPLPVAEQLEASLINVPSSAMLVRDCYKFDA
ncbi:LegC family aminotransferase [Cylindrospermopsis raciborskii]|uniref:LegC family aminotransferase n=1 Tax=Cylindrospermopsis raciborskii TaxID=77022 RepID=UPI0008DE8D2D|nr:LegC family aminotransferase [Cylindrospermopsis raciborskii]NLQ05925.1 LegC family aminotransferase [Cylindrospermopsis raciborskii MVCC19]OHY34547.1 aminotransferase DegT [Cylindrospermopsis raciborskii MVCC14]